MSWRVVIVYKRSGKLVYALETEHETEAAAEQVKRGLDINLDHENYATKVVRI